MSQDELDADLSMKAHNNDLGDLLGAFTDALAGGGMFFWHAACQGQTCINNNLTITIMLIWLPN